MAGGVLTLGSCTDELKDEPVVVPGDAAEDDGMVDVTVSMSLDEVVSRASSNVDGAITDLRDIDLLVYAVRDANDRVLHQYGKGVDDMFKKKDENGKLVLDENGKPIIDTDTYPALKRYHEDDDNNQTLMYVGGDFAGDNMVKFTLRVMRGTVFKLSVWAQSSKCEAYDFNYLSAVKVFYEDPDKIDTDPEKYFINNDVTRDAFCATSKFSIGQVDSDIRMTLTRPFARINVGILQDGLNSGNQQGYSKYKYSQIELAGVANYFNVIENRAWSEKDYQDYQAGKLGQNYNDRIFYDGKGNDEVKDAYRTPKFTTDKVTFRFSEFGPNGFIKIRDYSNWGGSGSYISERTYKSLSMCYVLVPEVKYNEDGSFGDYNENGGATNNAGQEAVKDRDGYTVYLAYNKDTETWSIVKAFDTSGNEVTEEYRRQSITNDPNKKFFIETTDDGKIIRQEFFDEFTRVLEDGTEETLTVTVLIHYNPAKHKWVLISAEDDLGREVPDYKFEDDSNPGDVVYPGTPTEPQVTLTLLSMKLSNEGYTNTLEYDEQHPMSVKRNWRTNLLFDSWRTIDPNYRPTSGY